MKGHKKNVFKTYNKIADWYFENRYRGLIEKDYLDSVIKLIGKQATILDIGCGTGIPIMDYLINAEMKVTGVDASYRMLEIAVQNLPNAEFIQEDMRKLSLDRKFDSLIAWHSFFHLPAEDQPAMFKIFKNHLNSKGVLLFTSGKWHGGVWGENGGENVHHGSLSTNEYLQLLEEHGFKVVKYKEDDPNCGLATVWLVQLIQ